MADEQERIRDTLDWTLTRMAAALGEHVDALHESVLLMTLQMPGVPDEQRASMVEKLDKAATEMNTQRVALGALIEGMYTALGREPPSKD